MLYIIQYNKIISYAHMVSQRAEYKARAYGHV